MRAGSQHKHWISRPSSSALPSLVTSTVKERALLLEQEMVTVRRLIQYIYRRQPTSLTPPFCWVGDRPHRTHSSPDVIRARFQVAEPVFKLMKFKQVVRKSHRKLPFNVGD